MFDQVGSNGIEDNGTGRDRDGRTIHAIGMHLM
jgi:hypothetical protein